jgi:hypothetical protein
MYRLIVIPIALAMAWTLLLILMGIPLRNGKQGYIVILGITLIIVGGLLTLTLLSRI